MSWWDSCRHSANLVAEAMSIRVQWRSNMKNPIGWLRSFCCMIFLLHTYLHCYIYICTHLFTHVYYIILYYIILYYIIFFSSFVFTDPGSRAVRWGARRFRSIETMARSIPDREQTTPPSDVRWKSALSWHHKKPTWKPRPETSREVRSPLEIRSLLHCRCMFQMFSKENKECEKRLKRVPAAAEYSFHRDTQFDDGLFSKWHFFKCFFRWKTLWVPIKPISFHFSGHQSLRQVDSFNESIEDFYRCVGLAEHWGVSLLKWYGDSG